MAPTGSRDGRPGRPAHGPRRGQRPDTTVGSPYRRPGASSWPVGAWASQAAAVRGPRCSQAEQPARRPLTCRPSHQPHSGNSATGSRGWCAGIAGRPNPLAAQWRNATDSRHGRTGGSHQPGLVSAAVPLRFCHRRSAPWPQVSRVKERVGSFESGLTGCNNRLAPEAGRQQAQTLEYSLPPCQNRSASGGHLEDPTDID